MSQLIPTDKNQIKIRKKYQLLTIRKDGPHFEVARRQANDRGLVQLAGDGRRKGQQLGQLQELGVLLFTAGTSGVL